MSTLYLAAALLVGSPAMPADSGKDCVWAGSRIATCFHGDIDKVPCDYAHPSEFNDADWARFAARCRKDQ